MKKVISLMLAAVMVLTACAVSVYADENAAESKIFYFNDFEVDIFHMASVMPKSNVIERVEDKKNSYLKIASPEGTSAKEDCLFQIGVKSTCSNLVVSCDLSAQNGGALITLQYSDTDGKRGSLFKTAKNGIVTSTGSDYVMGSIESGKWVNVCYVFNFEKMVYDAYWNGKRVEKAQPLKDETTGNMKFVRLYMSKGSKGDILVDNFAIYEGDKPRDITDEVEALPESIPMVGPLPQGSGKDYELDYADLTKLDSGVSLLVGNSNAYANKELVKVDSENSEVMPVIVNDRTLVPVRFISEKFGATVDWNDALRKVTVSGENKNIELVIDSYDMKVDSGNVTLDAAPQIINGRTMLPLRALVEALGKNVFWDARGLIIITNSDTVIDAKKDEKLVSAMYGYLKTGELALNYAVVPNFTPDIMETAFKAKDFDYTGEKGNTSNGAIAAKSLYYLTLAAHLDETAASSTGVLAKDEAIRRLRQLVQGGNEPYACVGPYWSHAVVAADLVLIKNTPVIYNELTADDKERMDWLMKALSIAGNWGFNDVNNYSTGVDLLGNFNKTWNPNYRNTYLNIVLSGAMYFGADELNNIFKSFSYDEYMAEFEKLGYTNIMNTWKVAGKDVMENGGPVTLVGSVGLSGAAAGQSGGTGAGVKKEFHYKSMGLDNINGIFSSLIEYTYGAVGQDVYGSPDGAYNCYILSGKNSPFNGYNGMMYEFAAAQRSSVGYCYDSMMIIMPMYANFKLLCGWDSTQEWQKKLDSLIYVGTEDLIFKMIEGYRSYASSTAAHSEDYEYGKVSVGYALDKDIWRNFHCMKNEEVTVLKNPNEPIELLPAPTVEPMNGITTAPENAIIPSKEATTGSFTDKAAIALDKAYTKRFTSEFDVAFDDKLLSSFDGVVIFDGSGAVENPITFKKANILIQFGTRINVRNGSKYFATQFPVAPNYRYHFRVEVDIPAKKYSVYIAPIYPTAGEEILVAKDMAYRSEAGEISDIGSFIPVKVSAEGTYWIENFKYDGE